MRVIKVNDKEAISEAIKVLKEGGLIIYPTETSYALGCDFFNEKAVQKIYEVKKRGFNNPLGVIIPNKEYLSKIVKTNLKINNIIKEYWPGPLNIVLDLIKKPYANYKFNNLALRISNNKFAFSLCKSFNKPIIATSANKSGLDNIYNPQQIKEQNITVDLFINAGILKKVKPSTIISLENNKVKILREGTINGII